MAASLHHVGQKQAARWFYPVSVVAAHATDCIAGSEPEHVLRESLTFAWLCCRAKANNEMQVSEVKQLLQLCSEFSSIAEGFGCRPVATLRTAVQLQCKSYLDALHHHTLTNLTGQPSSKQLPCHPDDYAASCLLNFTLTLLTYSVDYIALPCKPAPGWCMCSPALLAFSAPLV